MAQLNDILSLMERMDANDKKAQENRAKRMEEYKHSKPSRDYFKGQACKHLDECIVGCDCKHELFVYLVSGHISDYFIPEEWLEIHDTIMNLLSDKGYFDKYCLDHGLSVQSK